MTNVFVINPRNEVLCAAQAAGVNAYAVIDSSSDKENYSDRFTDALIIADDALNPLSVIWALRQHGVHCGDPDSVCVGLGDMSSEVASIVNSSLHIGNGHYASLESLEKMRNKYALRSIVGAQLPHMTGKYALATCSDDIVSLLEECSHGVVVKPIDASGSRNVFIVDSFDTLNSLYGKLQFPLLVEERFVGREYSVESLTLNGTHQNLMVTQKEIGGSSGLVETGHTQPAELTNEQMRLLYAAANSVLDSVGYSYGLSHVEFILQGSEPKLVEAHGRPGGDRITDLLHYSTGASSFERLFAALKTNDFMSIVPKLDSVSIRYVDLSQWKGSDLNWLEEMGDRPNVIEAKILRSAEDRGEIWKSSDRHAFVVEGYEKVKYDERFKGEEL